MICQLWYILLGGKNKFSYKFTQELSYFGLFDELSTFEVEYLGFGENFLPKLSFEFQKGSHLSVNLYLKMEKFVKVFFFFLNGHVFDF